MAEVRLIDANALRKKIEKWTNDSNRSASFVDSVEGFAYDEVLDAIDAAPTIEPKSMRPVAHLIHGTVPKTEDGIFCSKCRGFIGLEYSYIAEHAAFCWHCGAKMEESNDEPDL